jgi:putative membrane protein
MAYTLIRQKWKQKIYRMKKIITVLVSSYMLLACNSSSTNNNQDSVDSAKNVNDSTASTITKASDFATEAASGGMMEVQLGKLAERKAQSKRVKAFGAMMVKDHTQANDELKAIAAKQNITLPDSMSNDKKQHLDDLSKKTGKDFDKAYMDMMVDDHKEDVNKFKDAAQNSPDSAVKAFAAKAVPILQKHLDSAQAIQQSIK